MSCTPSHPFYVMGRGWTEAKALAAGDGLVTQSGEVAVVESVGQEVLDEPVAVYNFEVEGWHTYYVGDSAVLVHNDCGDVDDLLKSNADEVVVGAAKVPRGTKSSINQSNALVKEASKLTGRVQSEADNLVKNFLAGNTNPGIGTKHLASDIYYLRGSEGARVFYRMTDGTMDILGKSSKANEQAVINLVLKTFN